MYLVIITLLFSFSAFARPVIVSFDASLIPDDSSILSVTYTVKRNGKTVSKDSTALKYEFEAESGDVFYAFAVSNSGEKSNVSNIAFVPVKIPCDCKKKWFVAKNRQYSTRPMRDSGFNKTKNRILIGAECESKMIKEFSKTSRSLGYFFATNKDQFRGLVICKAKAK